MSQQYKFEENFINSELNKIYNWLCLNKLSINLSKTKYMIFKNRQRAIDDDCNPIIKIN